MKVLLVAVALLVVLAVTGVLYVGWSLRRAIANPGTVAATFAGLGMATVEVQLASTGHDFVVTEIDVPVALREALGLRPPVGFRLEPLPAGEDVDFAEQWNRENVRYVGSLSVPSGSVTRVSFPAERPARPNQTISFQCERKVGFGGSITFAKLQPTERTSKP